MSSRTRALARNAKYAPEQGEPMNTSAVEKQRQARMLRRLKPGSRVRATAHAGAVSRGQIGTVVDPNPFQADGIRRVKVQWDYLDWSVNVLPASIEESA